MAIFVQACFPQMAIFVQACFPPMTPYFASLVRLDIIL
jgi:hypothetical protein